MNAFRLGVLGLGLCGVFGCSSSDSGGGGLSDTAAFEGIYQLTAATKNPTSCDTSGDSRLSTLNDKFFIIIGSELFGEKYVELISCSDVADCQAKRAAQMANQGYQIEYTYTLTSASNATTLNGFEAGTGAPQGTQCVDRTYSEHVLTLAADHSVHLESRTKKLADQPQQDGFCTVEPAKAKQEAAGRPCSSIEALDGSFVQAK